MVELQLCLRELRGAGLRSSVASPYSDASVLAEASLPGKNAEGDLGGWSRRFHCRTVCEGTGSRRLAVPNVLRKFKWPSLEQRSVLPSLLGGLWVVKSRVISRVTILLPHIRGLITPVFTTHEPPSLAHLLAGSVWDWHEVPSQVGNLGS